MLKYIFTAHFSDGTKLEQPVDDSSVLLPGEKSSFYDVLQREEDLIAFELNGEGHSYGVSLSDGHFVIDGVPFLMCENKVEKLKLIYFRHHTHHFNSGNEETAHEVVYRLGWQGIDQEGKACQEVMQIF